jgi:hypothetical protein
MLQRRFAFVLALGAVVHWPAYAVAVTTKALAEGAAEEQAAPELVDVNERYPFRIPDWLWMDERRLALIPESQLKQLQYDLQILKLLRQLDDPSAADDKELEIARTLGQLFHLADLAVGGTIFHHAEAGTAICVQLDPDFSQDDEQTLQKAAELFLRCAMDDEVIQRAVASSVVDPTPMPQMHDPDGASAGITEAYRFYLSHRAKPESALQFKAHLRLALSSQTGDPAILCISKYHGNDWWGGAYYDLFHLPEIQLSRFSPQNGFLYIRLNADKMIEPVPSWNDPPFWAAKIAHEMLHNLGYWHPSYASPADRDANNQGAMKSFIVAYEHEIYLKAGEVYESDHQ